MLIVNKKTNSGTCLAPAAHHKVHCCFIFKKQKSSLLFCSKLWSVVSLLVSPCIPWCFFSLYILNPFSLIKRQHSCHLFPINKWKISPPVGMNSWHLLPLEQKVGTRCSLCQQRLCLTSTYISNQVASVVLQTLIYFIIYIMAFQVHFTYQVPHWQKVEITMLNP